MPPPDAESLHSKAPTGGEEEEFDDREDGVSKAKETVETFPRTAGLLVIAGGSRGNADAQVPPPSLVPFVAATSLGESPALTLAAAAAP